MSFFSFYQTRVLLPLLVPSLVLGASLATAGCAKTPPSVIGADGAKVTATRVNVDPKRFKELMADKNTVVVDVRTPGEALKMRIAGATLIDMHGADFAKKMHALPKDKAILVYCHSGGRSARASDQLIAAGYSKVYNLNGGIVGWREAGMATEAGGQR